MCSPRPQEYFGSVRTDDLGIGANDNLLRACRAPVQIVPCKVRGQKISDQVFRKKSTDAGASVDLECKLIEDGIDWSARFDVMPNTVAMVSITAGQVRAVSGGAAWTPKPEQPELEGLASAAANPYHGEVIGEISRADGRTLSRAAIILKTLV